MYTIKKKNKGVYNSKLRHFLIGMGSVLNLLGNYYRIKYSKHDPDAVRKNLENAWKSVGNEIENARKRFVQENAHLISN